MHTANSQRTIEGTDLLVAAGRTPNTQGMGLEEAGIELTDRGYIRVNDRLETTAPSTWAIGECAGTPQFTHMSLDDFRVIRDNLKGANRRSEEHTSELQSLMRISYAVFCLKKKTYTHTKS